MVSINRYDFFMMIVMVGSPGDVSEEPVMYEKRKKDCRMNCDIGDATAHSPTFPSRHLHHSSFSNPSVALPTSQLILQPFRRFTYVTAHSPILLSLLLCHRLFTYVTWRAAHLVSRHFKHLHINVIWVSVL